MAKKIKIIPLGGLDEIGKNITAIEYGDNIIIIDCGLAFPDETMPGIDVVIPDFSYLIENKEKVKALFVTHGHEDHIGGIPFLLKNLRVPVYGTKFTTALVQHKCNEFGISDPDLITIQPGNMVEVGCYKVEFIKTSHSIAGAVAFAITTPIGTIIHTGDFKIDFTPIDSEPIDINRFAYYGSKGVLALLSESTNIERTGYTQSEKEIGVTFERVFDEAPGRIIVATFASNVYRIQQVSDVAIRHNRVLCFQGRSMEQIVEIARKQGYLHIPDTSIVQVGNLNSYSDNEICVLTTGSQGEPMSGLFRMATSTHRLNVGEKDTVIISATAIPGNEKDVAKIIDQLYERGCNVIYDRNADVHVSGHACKEELRLMLAIIKPKYFIPVHGEFRHLLLHCRLAEEMGVESSNIFRLSSGDILELSSKSGKINGSVTNGSVMVDGVGDIDDIIIKDRKVLSNDGLFVSVVTIDAESGQLLCDPEIISRGFIYMRTSDELLDKSVDLIKELSYEFSKADRSAYSDINNSIKSKLKTFLRNETHRSPMIISIIQEIKRDGNN